MNIAELQSRAAGNGQTAVAVVTPGFNTLASFELLQRQAKLLATSTLVPASYRMVVEKLDYKGNVVSRTENPSAISNCVIALNMAMRMNADPIMVCQNLYIVEGRPSWSSQWIIAQINNCGRFSPIRFEIDDLGQMEAEYTTYSWDDKTRSKTASVKKVPIHNKRCVAWTVEKGVEIPRFSMDELKKHKSLYKCCKEYGVALVESPPVSIELSVKEGWYTRNGSKWQTMDEVMLRYRAAAFFGKLYAPELLMGIPSAEESEDIRTLELQEDGSYAPAEPATVDSLRKPPASAPSGVVIDQEAEKPKATPKPKPTQAPEPEPTPTPAPEQTQQEPAGDPNGKWEPNASELAEIARREQEESGFFGNMD